MKRFLALLVLGVLAILSLASVPQAAAATNSSAAAFVCTLSTDTSSATTATGPATPVTGFPAAAPFSCVENDKALTDAHFKLKAVAPDAIGNVYELWIKGGGDD